MTDDPVTPLVVRGTPEQLAQIRHVRLSPRRGLLAWLDGDRPPVALVLVPVRRRRRWWRR